MGYYSEKYKKLIRWNPWLTFQERRKTSKMDHLMRRIANKIYTEIPKDVKEHYITKALKEEKKVIRWARAVVKYEDTVDIDVTIQQEKGLKLLDRIQKEFEKVQKNEQKAEMKFPKLRNEFRKVNRMYADAIIEALSGAEKGERDLYGRIAAIIKSAGKENDLTVFMQKVRTIVREIDPGIWQQITQRREERTISQVQKEIRKDQGKFQKLDDELKKLMNSKEKKEKIEPRIEKVLREILKNENALKAHLKLFFLDSQRVLKRDFLTSMLLLKYLDDLSNSDKFDIAKKWLPELPAEKCIEEIDKLKLKVAHHFHTIAQSIRIMVSGMQEARKEVKL